MKKLGNAFWIFLSIFIMVYFIYKVAINSFTDNFLGSNPQHIKAVIINEKNFMGNQPVAARFSYSYLFEVKGTKYRGNSHDVSLKVGDSVDVVYNKDYPKINKPLNPAN